MKLRYPTLQFVIVSIRISLKSLDKTNFQKKKSINNNYDDNNINYNNNNNAYVQC